MIKSQVWDSPGDGIVRTAPSGSTITETWATTFKQAERDEVLRLITPSKSTGGAPYLSAGTLDALELQLMQPQLTMVSGRPSSPQRELRYPHTALPGGSSPSSPIKKLNLREWKPPITVGKSFLRKASEKREIESILGTKSQTLLPETSSGIAVGVADTLPVRVNPVGFGEDDLAPVVVRSLKRGGGDVIGASRRKISDAVLIEASERSNLLLTQLPEY